MCLIIVTTGRQLRDALLNTPDLLGDIFDSNPDGLGAMYTTSKGKLRTPKVLPRLLSDAERFIRSLPADERQVAVHFRLRTHGDTNLENCHPYTVLPNRVAMMHNGILAHGNAPDKTKSDTWHYINGYLRPLLEAYPKAFLNFGVQSLIESDITSGNRFVIMDHEGDMAVLNRETGIEHDGIWFSNTYAWSPELFIPGYEKPAPRRSSWMHDYEYDYGYRGWGSGPTAGRGGVPTLSYGLGTAPQLVDEHDPEYESVLTDDVWAALYDNDSSYLSDLLSTDARMVLETVFAENEFTCDLNRNTDMTAADAWLVEKLVDGDIEALVRRVEATAASADNLADVMCWYGLWVARNPHTQDCAEEAADETYAG